MSSYRDAIASNAAALADILWSMPQPLPVALRLWRGRYLAAYVALAVWFLAHLRAFHHPETGFSSLLWFGERFEPTRVPQLSKLALYTIDGDGPRPCVSRRQSRPGESPRGAPTGS
jgi:hypothetical protein